MRAQVLFFLAAISISGVLNAAAPGLGLRLGEPVEKVRFAAPVLPIAAKARTRLDMAKPRQFAVAMATNITPKSSGTWQQLEDGRWLWRLRIESAGAKSLNFAIDHLNLPASAELYVYDAEGRTVRGPYRAADVHGGKLWTPIIEGEAAVVEVATSAQEREQVDLAVTSVNHGFLSLNGPLMGESASCEIDVACSTGDAWRNEARSVAVYTFGGTFSCSGTLINNTAHDQTPYFLTAEHCIETPEQAASTVFYWNFQSKGCGTEDATLDQNQSGADLVARSELFAAYGGSDFSLLKLWKQPDPSARVYYSGWDRRNIAPSSGVVGIHHPYGDEKKISTSDQATFIASVYGQTAVAEEALTFLILPAWSQGVIEFGSSGSGLWNSEHHLVGHATYGDGLCGATQHEYGNGYGRLYSDWSGSSDPRYSIASHLDTLGSNEEVVDGLDPFATPAAEPGAISSGGSFSLIQAVLLGLASLIRLSASRRRRRQR